jgi:hypothetical protein
MTQLPELKIALQFVRPMLAVLMNPIRNLLINSIVILLVLVLVLEFSITRTRTTTRTNYFTASRTRSQITSARRGSLPTAGEYQTSLPFFSVGLRHAGCPAARHCSTIFLLLGALASRRRVDTSVAKQLAGGTPALPGKNALKLFDTLGT